MPNLTDLIVKVEWVEIGVKTRESTVQMLDELIPNKFRVVKVIDKRRKDHR